MNSDWRSGALETKGSNVFFSQFLMDLFLSDIENLNNV
ncbi:MAG: hypothetical protein ACD_73C00430G0002, partial [uncultured bacterium]